MSYLDLPRFHILGTFYTDPSTINNDPLHYDPQVTRPSPWQEPAGRHHFKFTEVTVSSGLDLHGNLVTEGDPLIGGSVRSTDQPSAAKLVDLDVYQQSVPTVYGFTLEITLAGGTKLTAAMDPCELNSLRFSRVLPTRGWNAWDEYGGASFGGDTYAAGSYQTVLRVDPGAWPAGQSGLLDQLRSVTTTDAKGNILISFRFVPDSYQNVPWHEDFRTGRVVATLGPVGGPKEPAQLPGGRWLKARPVHRPPASEVSPWYWPDLYDAPCKTVDRGAAGKTLVIDLANAIAIESPGGPPVDLGNLTAEFGDGSSGAVGPFQANESFYTNLGGIIEMPLTEAQWAARKQPLRLVTSHDDIGGPALWSEAPSGRYHAVNQRSFRMTSEPQSASRVAESKVLVTQWGDPAPGVQLAAEVVPVTRDPNKEGNGTQGATVPWVSGCQGDTAQADGALVASISPSDGDGFATLRMEVVKDPGYRTTQLDGQLYFVVVYDPTSGAPNLFEQPAPQEQQASCVAFSSAVVNQDPSWDEVREMMVPYVKLYPGMEEAGGIKLTDEQSFFTFALNPPWKAPGGGPALYHPDDPYTLPDGKQIQAGAIPYFLTRPIDDPRCMPITRDLSPNKLLTVLYYIYNLQQQATKPGPPEEGTS